ncbi:uncharacterized protein [Onthophagus taurus]|uniref:uncharacterized protein n=1 Tax=Onthophagus taurus TaxID=166361 RepID=UPI0039BE196F
MACKLTYCLAHLVIISLVYVEVTSKCRKVPEEKPDFKKLSGTWYIIQTDDSTELSRSCVKYNFVYSTTKKAEVITAYRILGNETQKKFIATLSNGQAKVAPLANDGTYASNWMDLKIPYADYDQYYSVYGCDPKSNNSGFVYVGVRNKSLEDCYIKIMTERWEKLDFDTNKIFSINQQNCPETN